MNCSFKSLLAALILLCSTVATAHDFEVGGIFYNIRSSTEKTVDVTYKGDSYNAYSNEYTGNVTVPSSVEYNGETYSVTSIGGYAFYHCVRLTSIEIPGSVTSIGTYAFEYCPGLTSVTIGDGVTSIGYGAFCDCDGLTSIEIPGSVTRIVNQAFLYCDGLTSVTIGDGVTSIEGEAFYYCSGLTSVTSLATTAPALGSEAFDGISSDATLYYPAGSDYSSWAQYFANTEAIAVQISKCGDNLTWNIHGGVLTISGTGAMWDYSYNNSAPWSSDEISRVVIEDGVTSIGNSAFEVCRSLTSIEIPGSVTSIGEYAFFYCSGLTSVTSLATTAPVLGSYAFDRISSDATLYYPAGSDYSSWEQYFANTETIYVQSKCGDNLTWNIHGGVLTISGTGAMWDYSYNNSAPWSSDEISRVVIEDGVTSIGKYAFYYCDALRSIEIPGSVTSIGSWAFRGCSGLTSIEIPGSVTSIGYEAFRGCSGLTSIEIPGSVTSIGNYAFQYCSGLTSVTIGDGVTSIGNYAFEYCRGLTSIEIPGSVTSIGESAFYDCSGLTSIVVAEENTVYDSRNNCNAIIETATNTLIQGCQNTIIPGSVTSIGNRAFHLCSGLTSIEIPGSVTSIGNYAFSYCSRLTSVTSLATTAPGLGSGVFTSISSDATLYYPAGSDYRSWVQYFAKMEEITEEFPEEEEVFGDLNGDGTVSVSDIQVLVNIILGN